MLSAHDDSTRRLIDHGLEMNDPSSPQKMFRRKRGQVAKVLA
jgi:hypothetical protein